MEQIKNIKELRNSLSENYSKMKSKKMSIAVGKELANTAGKIITSLKVELEYRQMVGNKDEIDFLKY